MKKRPTRSRQAIDTACSRDWIQTRPLLEGQSLPLLIEPKREGIDLCAWAKDNKDYIDELFVEHHALLFRNFEYGPEQAIQRFDDFVSLSSSGDRLHYKDRSTPRNTHGDRIYDATIYPAEQTIALHNEGTYWTTWARKLYFACTLNATSGGQTPIADVHAVYKRIDPVIRQEFEQRGILYVRNFNSGFGLDWQTVFQTEDKQEAEAYCHANRIEFEWKDAGRMRTRQRRPAVRAHPDSGLPLWFNHGAFFHVTSLEPAMRDMFLAELGEDELPYNTYYGDGGAIDPEVIAHLREAYLAEKIAFRWQTGDIALYDNMRVAHAREPYTGERTTLVAMTEGYVGSEE
jgi:alpha-ketoglutarate-dependent taurine dioxygenase